MMNLRSAAPSPFGRKVKIALSVLGFSDVKVEPADTMDPHDGVRAQNPLGKIPVLIVEDEEIIRTTLREFLSGEGYESETAASVAQATALAAERTKIDLLTRRMTASVLLIQALGGGWDTSQLPTAKDVATGTE